MSTKEKSSPAFPEIDSANGGSYGGMNMHTYAAIHLKQPDDTHCARVFLGYGDC